MTRNVLWFLKFLKYLYHNYCKIAQIEQDHHCARHTLAFEVCYGMRNAFSIKWHILIGTQYIKLLYICLAKYLYMRIYYVLQLINRQGLHCFWPKWIYKIMILSLCFKLCNMLHILSINPYFILLKTVVLEIEWNISCFTYFLQPFYICKGYY